MLNEFRVAFAAKQSAVNEKIAAGVPVTDWADPVMDRALGVARTRAKIVLDEIAPGWRDELAKKPFFQTADAFLDSYAGDRGSSQFSRWLE